MMNRKDAATSGQYVSSRHRSSFMHPRVLNTTDA